MSNNSRIIALDIGEARIGVAIIELEEIVLEKQASTLHDVS